MCLFFAIRWQNRPHQRGENGRQRKTTARRIASGHAEGVSRANAALLSFEWGCRRRWPQSPVIRVLKFAGACCLRSLWGFLSPHMSYRDRLVTVSVCGWNLRSSRVKMKTSRPIKREKTPSQQALGKDLRKFSFCSRSAAARCREACRLISPLKCK